MAFEIRTFFLGLICQGFQSPRKRLKHDAKVRYFTLLYGVHITKIIICERVAILRGDIKSLYIYSQDQYSRFMCHTCALSSQQSGSPLGYSSAGVTLDLTRGESLRIC